MAIDTTPVLVLVAASTAPTAVKNVAEYVCDGTADNAKITDAIADVASTGGLVQLTPGTFNIAATVDVPATFNGVVAGSGWGTKLVAVSGLNDHMVEFSTSGGNVTGATFRDLWLDHDASAQTGGCAIYAKGAVECEFQHLRITEPYDAGIWFHEISGGNVGHHNRTLDCLFESGSSSAGAGQGIRYQASDANWSIGDSFNEMGGSSGDAYAIKDWAGINKIISPYIVGGKGGILVQDQGHTSIIGPTFDRVTQHAISLAGSSFGINVKGAQFYRGGNGTSTNTYSSVVLDGDGYHTIDGHWWSGTNPTHNSWLRSFVRFLGASTNHCVITGTMQVDATLGTGKVETNAQTDNQFLVGNYP